MAIKILINGANGQLGKDLQDLTHLFPQFQFKFFSHDEWDVCDDRQSQAILQSLSANYLIHAAAYTQVDDAETNSSKCIEINANASGRIANICAFQRTRMIYISSDYVFHQEKPDLIKESTQKNPRGVYATSKSMGEDLVTQSGAESLILRTSWLYSSHGHNFVKTMLRISKTKDVINVVNDQVGSPTYAYDLGTAILNLITKWELHPLPEDGPIFHYSNEGTCSWYEFAKYIFELAGISITVNPISTLSFGSKTPRPPFSGLDCSKFESWVNMKRPHWKIALQRCMQKLISDMN